MDTQTPGDVSSVTTTWALSPLCTAWPAEQDWLFLPWAVSRHTPPTPTPTTQPGIQSPLKKRYCIELSDFFHVFTLKSFFFINPGDWLVTSPQPENLKLDPELSGQKAACACSLASCRHHQQPMSLEYFPRCYHPDNLNWRIDIPILNIIPIFWSISRILLVHLMIEWGSATMEQWEEGDPVYWIQLYQDKSRLIHENGIFDDVYLGWAALKSG